MTMIYFLQATDGGPVKIGHTDNLDVRRKALESHYGRKLAVLATMPGDLDTEAEVHARFDHLRYDRTGKRGKRPEQFRPAADLMAFIGLPLLVGANPETVEVMEPAPGTRKHSAMIRLDRAAHELASLAAGLMRMSLGDYVSRILTEAADRDIASEAAKLTKPPRAPKGGE